MRHYHTDKVPALQLDLPVKGRTNPLTGGGSHHRIHCEYTECVSVFVVVVPWVCVTLICYFGICIYTWTHWHWSLPPDIPVSDSDFDSYPALFFKFK